MIQVTRLNDSVLLINAENIQSIEANPQTVITFLNRDRLIVKEPADEVGARILRYRRHLMDAPAGRAPQADNAPPPAA